MLQAAVLALVLTAPNDNRFERFMRSFGIARGRLAASGAVSNAAFEMFNPDIAQCPGSGGEPQCLPSVCDRRHGVCQAGGDCWLLHEHLRGVHG